MAGSIGWGTWAGRHAGASCWQASGALQGPWVPGGSWGGRRAVRTVRRGAARQSAAVSAGRARRPGIGARIAWRRLAAMAGDVLMVLVWAAMIPGVMWLGTAAGF